MKNRAINRINYWIIVSLFAIMGMYANAVNNVRDDTLNQHLPPQITGIVRDYHDDDYLVKLLVWDQKNPINISSDGGKTWIVSEIRYKGHDVVIQHMAANSKGIIVAVGSYFDLARNDRTPPQNVLASSNDNGSTWHVVEVGEIIRTIALTPTDEFVVVTKDSLLNSTDGSNWKKIASVESLGLDVINEVAVSKGRIVAIGARIFKLESSPGQNKIISATSTLVGTKNEKPQIALFSSETILKSVVVNTNGIFVVVGKSSNSKCFLVTSTDGINWQDKQSELPPVCNSTDIRLDKVETNRNNGRFVAFGSSNRDHNNFVRVVMTSIDGQKWEDSSASLPTEGPWKLNEVRAAENSKFILLHRKYTTQGFIPKTAFTAITTSTNGTDWSKPIIVGGPPIVIEK
ncbi:MAG: hypothetical protein K0R14_70 [Burkholderiales bacterium]|jgi:hypothetical protein|nr:hypothetical protein [Burkholderiales bacterium]